MTTHALLKLDNIMYRVRDLDAASAFYTGILGLTQVWRDDERRMIGFQMARGDEIVIHADENLPDFDYSFLVEDVAAFCARVKEAGHTVAVEPFAVRCGLYAVLQDPDGNLIPIIDLTAFGGVPRTD